MPRSLRWPVHDGARPRRAGRGACGLRHLQHRPDVRASRSDAGGAGRRPERRARARAAAPVDLPADDRAEHAVRVTARAPGRGRGLRHARPVTGAVPPRAWRATRSRPSRARATAAGTTSTTGSSATTSASAPGRTVNCRSPQRVLRQIRWRDPTRYVDQALADRRWRRKTRWHSALPFEFMLNALRLKDGFEMARFSERTGLAADGDRRAARAGRAARIARARPDARLADRPRVRPAVGPAGPFLPADPAAARVGRADN